MNLTTDALSALAADLTGLEPVGVVASALPSDVGPSLPPSRAITVAFATGLAIVALAVATAIVYVNRHPQGEKLGEETFSYRGKTFFIRPYAGNKGTKWWIEIKAGGHTNVEGEFSSRKIAVLRAHRIIDYFDPLR